MCNAVKTEKLKAPPTDNAPHEIVAINKITFRQRVKAYKRRPLSFVLLLLVVLSAVITLGVLLSLIVYILVTGIPHLTLSQFNIKYTTENVSMLPAIINTLLMTLLTLVMAVPIGIFAAIYMVEYAKRGNKLVKAVRLTAETLSGIPSIVFGLFGYLMFVNACKMGYSLMAGSLTLAIMVLPLIMRTTEEALKSVPDSYREGSFGLGAGKLRTVFTVVLPSAVPGILSGIILAIGRIVGETAALIFTAGTGSQIVKGVGDSGRTLAVHMYSLFVEGLHMDEMAATAVILLIMVLLINLLSGLVAKKFSAGSANR